MNRLQLGLYGFQQSVIGLATDTGEMARDAGMWAYAKTAMDEAERKEFFKGWDANVRAEKAMEQSLPEAEGFFGEMFQGVAENAHWFIPYGLLIGKGGKMVTAARGLKPAEAVGVKAKLLKPKTLLVLALAFAAGSVGIKGLFVRRPELLAFQFLPQLMGIAFSFLALLWALAGEERYLQTTSGGFRKTVDMLANMSLEVYLTQFMAIDLCKGLAFPLNMVLMLAGTFGAAYPLWKIDRWAQKALCGLFFHENKGGTAA